MDLISKILIVDDRKENIHALSELLKFKGVEVLATQKPNEALELLTEHDFCLALLDVQMPEISGFELARLIRGVKKFKHLPIIFVTAHSVDERLTFEGYDVGAVDLLYKPLNPHIVRSKVSVFVELDQQKKMMKQQLKELEKLRLEADRANQAKAQFLANMSHEIRTPIGTIMGFADLLKMEWPPREQGEMYSDLIVKSSEELLKIVDDVLDLSKIEAGKISVEKIPFSLEELLFDFEAASLLQAKAKNIGFKLHIDKNVPVYISSDPTKIRQILNNIVGNAIKFTSDGSVDVFVNYEKGNLYLKVSDTGCGITKDQMRNLFQPFNQADVSTSRKYGGTGLGLVLTRKLSQILGGDFQLLKSEKNVGSTFEARIKVQPVVKDEIPNKKGDAERATIESSNLDVLLVEDIEENQILITKMMEKIGIHVDVASSGREGIEKALSKNYDVIFMDIQMPEMDGFEALSILKDNGYGKPIVALSAHVMKHQVEACLQKGFTSFLSKPLTISKLTNALMELQIS